MPEAPVLSDTQRREAYERSLETRRMRAGVKANMARWATAGGSHLNVFEMVWPDPTCQGMKVYDLLTALPGVGRQKAIAMLDTAGIPAKNTVRACGPRQRERLFDLLR